MSLSRSFQDLQLDSRGSRSQSAQGLTTALSNSAMKIPLPPRLWITDVSEDSSDDMECSVRDDSIMTSERSRVRSRYRHNKQRSTGNVPIGIFWDIENCQVPRGCSAIDVVTAIRAKFLPGRREADFVVVCDVRKEAAIRLQELNDAQISLIHVCGTQKNAADEKLRQCMRRFGELHTAPAALLLISGDINFAADLSDFRYRKNMDVILVHKQNTSSALIACATSHHCYNDLTANLPRNSKVPTNFTEEQDAAEPTCKLEIVNLPSEHAPERVSRRLRRLADNCGGKVLSVTDATAILKFPTPDHAFRALKRMDGEDVFGCKIGTRLVRACAPSYSSDEGYGTATANVVPARPSGTPQLESPRSPVPRVSSWALALQQLPPPPPPLPATMPRKIRGTHGSANLDQSGSSSANSAESRFTRDASLSRAASPWNCSQLSEASATSDVDDAAELTVANLPLLEPKVLQEMLTSLFAQYVPVTRVCVWTAGEGPLATVSLRCEADARFGIAKLHKRRLDQPWGGRRLELSLGRPSPAPNLDVLRARLRAILLDSKGHTLPLLRLRDAYASRHCCALTTSDLTKVKDTVLIHEGFGRMVQLVDLTPVSHAEMEEAPWKCHAHAANTGHDDGGRILAPVCMEVAVLAQHTHVLLENHGGILPLLSFVECYEATFPPLVPDPVRGVALELLLRSVPGVVVRDSPSRHVTWRSERQDTPSPLSHYSDSSSVGGGSGGGRARSLRTAPALEPMLTLFERELVDLLRAAPKCCIAFSKLIPAFHHHFGRQCRVADYGFTKLPDLLAALSNTIVVLGSGSSRVITISSAAQARRWTTDLVKLLRAQPGRAVYPHDIPQLYQLAYGKPFSPVDYGVCTLHELMQRVSPQAIVYGTDMSVSLPRRTPTSEEKARTVQFAVQAIELLCYTPNLRMEFSRFVPAYHAHFGRQLRVAHYGCVKLVELFELIPEAVRVRAGSGGEREVSLAVRPARAVVGQRLKAITPTTLPALAAAYVAQFGAVPLSDMLDAASLEELVVAAGGAIEDGIVRAPGDAPRSVSAALVAAAALSSDRSVRGSGDDYFSAAYRELAGRAPDARALAAAGVITHRERRVALRPEWRAVFRVAQILDLRSPLSAAEIFVEYTKRYEPIFPTSELGFESTLEFLRHYREVFSEDGAQRFCVCAGVAVPRCQPRAPPEDLSIHDTPPGQKGSRVFESPKTSIWSSPPASALPTPSALLAHDVKRRTRLAAQFNIA